MADTRVRTLKQFYDLMADTCRVRKAAATTILKSQDADAYARELASALAVLKDIPTKGGKFTLEVGGGRMLTARLRYEIGELEKDLVFLNQGEAALMERMSWAHPGFATEVDRLVETLGGDWRVFVSDRDGTVNNYCGRYASSVQSAYNAVFLSRFASKCAGFPILLTSAPLMGPGIVDMSANPDGYYIYAASKGREYVGTDGIRHHFPIDPGRQLRLDALNQELSELIAQPEYAKFGLIGSGLQFKFGQSTVARQDIGGSIGAEESEAFLATLTELVRGQDPDGTVFRIEDTGLDVEIILTVEKSSGDAGLKDFDKGDGVRFLNDALGMNMAVGPHLVCGDTGSDVPMLEAAMEICPGATSAVFVTRDEKLAKRVEDVCPRALVVAEPDVLVAALNRISQRC